MRLDSPFWTKILFFVPYVGPTLASQPRQRVRRTMTAGGKIEAIDGAKGEILFTHPISQQSVEDKESTPFIGGGGTPMSLVPEQQKIKDLLENELRWFVSRMVPTAVRIDLLVHGSSGSCSNGVNAMKTDNNAAALAFFKKALAKEPGDYRAAFGAAVACELMHDLAGAQKNYESALSLANHDLDFPRDEQIVWEQCAKRVKQRIENGEPNSPAPSPRASPPARPPRRLPEDRIPDSKGKTMTRLLLSCASLLVLSGLALAQATQANPAPVSEGGKVVIKDFEWKSASLDTVEREAVVGAVEQAVRQELKTEMASKEASQKQKAFQALDAAAQEAGDAVKGSSKLVKYEKIDGPRKRIGAPGYIVITAEVNVSRIRELYMGASAKAAWDRSWSLSPRRRKPRTPRTRWEPAWRRSKIAAAVERELINQGYRVINGNQIQEIQDMKADWAKLDGKDQKVVQGIGAQQKTDIIVTGVSKVVGPEPRKIEGLNDLFYAWVCDATGRAFYTDTVEHQPCGIVQVRCKLGGADQRGVRHGYHSSLSS